MTTSPQKRKGSAFEREVVRVLRERGAIHAERAMRFPDRGDIDGLPTFVVEAKCVRRMELAEWMDETAGKAVRAHGGLAAGISRASWAPYPVVVVKRRGRPAEQAYVVMELSHWASSVAPRG